MYYTVIKHDRHLRTRGKWRKHEPQASAFYISWVFSNDRSILSQCKTRLRLLHLLYDTDFTRAKQYTLFQNGGCLRRSGSSSTRARHRGPRFNVYMFTCGSTVRNMPQNCCVPGCKKKVYEEDGVKISFHKFPEDRELFRKWIVAIRRDVGKEFRVTDHTRV